MTLNKMTIRYQNSKDLLQDARQIIDDARAFAYSAVNVAMVQRNWLLGKRIAEEELGGESRAEYGAEVVKRLSRQLSKEYGKGFDESSLYKFLRFHKEFPGILDSASPESVPLLSWLDNNISIPRSRIITSTSYSTTIF